LSPPQFGRGAFAAQSPVTRPNRQLPKHYVQVLQLF